MTNNVQGSDGVIFISGIADSVLHSKAILAAKSPHQSAANRFQNSLIDGLIQLKCGVVYSVSSPFFGSWPLNHAMPFIPSSVSCRLSGEVFYTAGFVNIPGVKVFSKFLSIYNKCASLIREKSSRRIICYSGNLPYIASLAALKFRFKDVVTCVILTDLPKYPADCSFAYKFYMRLVEEPLFNMLIKHIDCCVVLTEHMIPELGLSSEKCVVVEGMYSSPISDVSAPTIANNNFKILYTGTLDFRYGIRELLDAMDHLRGYPISLTVCGQGVCADEVLARASSNPMINFVGYVPPEMIFDLQRSVDLLVNPRNNVGLYNRYSFPSKTMEYLASGTPVLMYKLDGVPSEYFQHVFFIDEARGESLAEAILRVYQMASSDRSYVGLNASSFILENKSAHRQCEKILLLMNSVDCDRK